jgi:predicted 3-demethylubiquinone-9 3-methyltransferase (glyoxalase superfamily)
MVTTQRLTSCLWFADEAKKQRAMETLLTMKKLDLAAIRRALEEE